MSSWVESVRLLKMKMVWPDCVAGGGGTTQLVENSEIGFPVVLAQDAYVIHPLPSKGTESDFVLSGRDFLVECGTT
jgi:hypothetical protein